MSRLSPATLIELEETAARMARLAGDHIRAAPTQALHVELKPAPEGDGSPVCNVDRDVEARLRALLREEFPQHAILGEEGADFGGDAAQFTWVIDPLDGTSNFVNGLPLYASSIGVLCGRVPVAGAVWCSMSHAFSHGVYHARAAGALHLDGVLVRRRVPAGWRGLAAEPGGTSRYGESLDTRVLACAALECAFAAAGVLQLAFLAKPAVWDVAAGVVLARAAGCSVLTRAADAWEPLENFASADKLRDWRQPVLIRAENTHASE
jgi:myo-inositol-1(or 4)-monophosphatase